MKDLREVYVDKKKKKKRLITPVCYKNMLPEDQQRLIKQTEIKKIPSEFKDKSNKQENGQGVANGQKSRGKGKTLGDNSAADNQA